MSARRRKSRRSHRSLAGWTMIEVMMSMAILVAGGAGILALQQATSDGNIEARQMTTATQIARMWVERLKRDTLLWNAPNILVSTQYLSAVPPGSTAPVWTTPVPADLTQESYAFDYFGNDTAPGSAGTTYCAQDRLQWVDIGNTMRADVRVWWSRRGAGNRHYVGCGVGSETAIGNDVTIHAVSTSVLLHWTRRQ